MKSGTIKWLVVPGLILGLVVAGLIARGFSVPPSFTYQGRLTGSGLDPINATVDLTFTFYSSADGDTVLLSVTEENVSVLQGLYKVEIGSGVAAAMKVLAS